MTIDNHIRRMRIMHQLDIEKSRNAMPRRKGRARSGMTDKKIDMACHYYGIGKKKSMNLIEVGEMFGMTSERVRQIIEKFIIALNEYFWSNRDFIDFVERVNRFSESAVLMEGPQFKKEMADRGFISSPEDSVLWVAMQPDLFHTVPSVCFERFGDKDFVLPFIGECGGLSEQNATKQTGGEIAGAKEKKKKYRKNGVRNGVSITKEVRKMLIKEATKNGFIDKTIIVSKIWPPVVNNSGVLEYDNDRVWRFIMSIASETEGFFDIDKGWFGLKGVGRNVFENAMRKVVCVSNGVSAEELKKRVLYSTKIERLPSDEGIARFFSGHEDIDVVKEGEKYIFYNKKMKMEKELGKDEMVMYKAISEKGPMKHSELYAAAKKFGISFYSFQMRLTRSPIFIRVERGVYSI